MYYSLSRLAALDVKWADLFDAGAPSFHRTHYNPYCELIAAVDGPVRIEADRTRYTLQTGETLLLHPWETHNGWDNSERQGAFFWIQFACNPPLAPFVAAGDADLRIVHAEKTELRTEDPSHEDLLLLPKLHKTKRRFELLQLFEQLAAESQSPKGYFRFRQTLLLGEIVSSIATDFMESSHRDTAFPASYGTYRRLVNHLNNFYEQDLGKTTLEKELDRTYEYLCQVFRKYAGTTIVHYVHQLRVQRAKYLLLHSDQSVGEIAEKVGFRDAFYFSRVFKRLEGLSPQHYRDRAGTV